MIADSALFSTLVTEYADQAYVGTALALQLAIGFALTAATIWLIPILEDDFGWKWAFAFLAPGPLSACSRWCGSAACSGGRSRERLLCRTIGCATSHATTTTSPPAAASTQKWFPVATITKSITNG